MPRSAGALSLGGGKLVECFDEAKTLDRLAENGGIAPPGRQCRRAIAVARALLATETERTSASALAAIQPTNGA
jgi:hypothetical protein